MVRRMSPLLGDRSLFPTLTAKAYLAHAAISPLSQPVVDTMREVQDDYAAHGVGAFGRAQARLKHLREGLARLIGAQAEDIGLVQNTTAGVIDIAFGLPWKRGDRVVLFEGEFPANVLPWQQAAREFGLELSWLPLSPFFRSHEEGLEMLRAVLEEGARLVAVSAVQFKTGYCMPLSAMAEMAHAHGAELFVDAIQAVGETPIDVSRGIDYLSCGSHKGLMGPEGGGFVYVAPSCAKALEPRLAGWTSVDRPEDFLVGDAPCMRYDKPFRQSARAFEVGTQNMIGFAGLDASVALLNQLPTVTIHAHVNRYLDVLEEGLVERGFVSHRGHEMATRSTLLSIEAPSGVGVSVVAARLRSAGVICNTPDGFLRFSPHWPNHRDEVPVVLKAIDDALR